MDIRYILQVLFPYLLLLYAVDCLVLVKISHLLFTSRLSGNFNLKRAGLYVTGLLPGSWMIRSQADSLFATTRGLYFREIPGDTRRANFHDDYTFIDYDDLDDISYDDDRVKVNRKWTVRMSSPAGARQAAHSVRDLVDLSQSDRKEQIRTALTRSVDLETAKAVVDAAREKLWWLSALSTILFINVVIVLPFTLFYRPISLFLGTLISIIVANYLIVLTLALAAHWNLFRDDVSGRFHLILHLILLPVSAMHPLSQITRELLSSFDHLTVAAAIAPDTLPSLMREELLRITFSRTGSEPKDYTLYWNLREDAVRDLCMKAGLNPVDLLENR
ncbi:hypothetical protein EP232_02360, partial [bacterium]